MKRVLSVLFTLAIVLSILQIGLPKVFAEQSGAATNQPGTKDMLKSLSKTQRKALNLFISNFSEVSLNKYSYNQEKNNENIISLMDFATSHIQRNSWDKYVKAGDYGSFGDAKVLIEDIIAVLNRYFYALNISVNDINNAANYIENDRCNTDGTSLIWAAGWGEMCTQFSQVENMIMKRDGTYDIQIMIYSWCPGHLEDLPDWEYEPYESWSESEASIFKKIGQTEATIVDFKYNGEDTYQVVSYGEKTGENASETTTLSTEHTTSKQETNNKLLIGQDNQKFSNTDKSKFFGYLDKLKCYILSDKYFNKLVQHRDKGVKDEILKEEYSPWSGTCFGISCAMALSFTKDISFNNFDSGADCFYEMDIPKKNSAVRDLINYYQLAQYLPEMQKTPGAWNKAYRDTGKNEQDLKEILQFICEKTEEIKTSGVPLLIEFQYLSKNTGKQVSHCVVGNSHEVDSDSTHRVEIVDPNSTGSYISMKISSDYSSWSLETEKGEQIYFDTGKWQAIAYRELKVIKNIDIDGENNSNEKKAGPSICIADSAEFSVIYEGKTLLSSTGGELKGDILKDSIRFVCNSNNDGQSNSKIAIDLPGIENCTVNPDDDGSEISYICAENYSSVKFEGKGEAGFDDEGKLMVGGAEGNYTVNMSNLSSEDGALIRIDSLKGSTASFEQTDEGLLAISPDSFKGITVTSYSSSEQADVRVTADETSILIKDKPNDETGVFQVYASENNDGNFTKLIAESKAAIPINNGSSGLNIQMIGIISIAAIVMVAFAVILILFLKHKKGSLELVGHPLLDSTSIITQPHFAPPSFADKPLYNPKPEMPTSSEPVFTTPVFADKVDIVSKTEAITEKPIEASEVIKSTFKSKDDSPDFENIITPASSTDKTFKKPDDLD